MLSTNRLPPTGGKRRPTRTNHFVLPTLSFRATDFFAAPTDFSLSPYGVTVETPASPPATIPTQTPNQKQTHFRLVNPRIFLLICFLLLCLERGSLRDTQNWSKLVRLRRSLRSLRRNCVSPTRVKPYRPRPRGLALAIVSELGRKLTERRLWRRRVFAPS